MASSHDVDAVVIGSGPNGLVAANLLADAGWRVVVLEAAAEPGGAVRSGQITAPGFTNDLYSAFYPFAAASPVLQALDLPRHGLRWTHAPAVLAHPVPGGPAAVLHRDPLATAATLGPDGVAWLTMYREFDAIADRLLPALLGLFPPVRAGLRLARALGPGGARAFTRLALLPVRRMAEERFGAEAARLLLTGAALHADVSPDGAGSGLLGWLLAGLGQRHGFPVPEGGAGRLTDALVARLAAAPGRTDLVCSAPVTKVIVRRGRAVGVRTASGDEYGASRAVLADVDVVTLCRRLVGEEFLPTHLVDELDKFHRGPGTVKVDWALSAPVPWADPAVAAAGCVHLGGSTAELGIAAAEVHAGRVPERPFTILGQMTTTDPTRSPAGTESAWAYAHVPAGAPVDVVAKAIEAVIEAEAPGFGDLVIGRHVAGSASLQAADANLVGGDIGGGTAQLHQQLIFRPVPGLGRPELPVKGLYLASASAHPGGGVHGAPGANAARAALTRARFSRR